MGQQQSLDTQGVSALASQLTDGSPSDKKKAATALSKVSVEMATVEVELCKLSQLPAL
ncbi:hypothetical protein DVH05_000106 [Phytophthora capsici]|nr:hypothetical protein DVH05_000106 [Phytophthora capsici]